MTTAYSSDLQRVWKLVQDLSAQLQANQDETGRLKRLVEALEAPLESDPEDEDDEHHADDVQNGELAKGRVEDTRQYRKLRRAYDRVLRDNVTLSETNADLAALCADYEAGMDRVASQIREAAFTSRTKETAVARRHADQLGEVNGRVLEVEAEKAHMRRQLFKVADLVRKAHAAHTDYDAEAESAALRVEIQALKKELGLGPDEVIDGPRVDEELAKRAAQAAHTGGEQGAIASGLVPTL